MSTGWDGGQALGSLFLAIACATIPAATAAWASPGGTWITGSAQLGIAVDASGRKAQVAAGALRAMGSQQRL
jgi:hypothetical protein